MGTMTTAMHRALDTTASVATLDNIADALAAGYKIARGVATLVNAGPGTLPVVTGLTTITDARVCLNVDPPVVSECMWVTCTWVDGTLTVKGWIPTAAGNLLQSQAVPPGGGTAVSWIAIGTV